MNRKFMRPAIIHQLSHNNFGEARRTKTHLFIRSFVRSIIYSFIHPFVHPFVHQLDNVGIEPRETRHHLVVLCCAARDRSKWQNYRSSPALR
jgi:hypothetical protein